MIDPFLNSWSLKRASNMDLSEEFAVEAPEAPSCVVKPEIHRRFTGCVRSGFDCC